MGRPYLDLKDFFGVSVFRLKGFFGVGGVVAQLLYKIVCARFPKSTPLFCAKQKKSNLLNFFYGKSIDNPFVVCYNELARLREGRPTKHLDIIKMKEVIYYDNDN